MLPVLLLIPILLILPLPALSATIHVPHDFGTIQSAIEDGSTVDGDIILIEPGEYTENINFRGKNITIGSRFIDTGDESYITQTIINGDANGRVVVFRNDETRDAQLIGLTITNGLYIYGGGIYMSASSPTLKRLIITGNTATNNGGGIYCTQASGPLIDHVTLTRNTGAAFGGFNTYNGSNATISNSIIWENNPADLPDQRVISYSNVQGGDDQNGNMERDPGFVDANAGDFNLTENSACIDAGDPDAEGDPDGTRTDMGALSYSHFPIMMVDPIEINFGEIHFGRTIENQVYVINSGRVALNVEAIQIVGEDTPFHVISGGEAIELAPEDTSTITVQYRPVSAGEFADTLIVSSDDPENSPTIVVLTGVASAPEPILGVSPMRVNFGNVTLLEQAESEITIRNSGDADLRIDTIHFEANADNLFSVLFDGAITVAPGAEVQVTVTFLPSLLGAQEEDLSIETNDPQVPRIVLPVTAIGVRPAPHWQFTGNTGVNHSILVLAATIDGDPLTMGSEIAVFTPDGLCVGEEFWLGDQIGFAAWGDNEMTQEVDGFREGEAIRYKFWDIAAQSEYDTRAELVEGDASFGTNGLSVVNLSVRLEAPGFFITIGASWSIVSAPVIPEIVHIPTLWRPIVQRNHLVIVKDASGRFYVASIGFSNMANWDYRNGYLVRGTAIDSLEVVGQEVAENAEIPLRVGWNLAAYFPAQALSAQTAFRNIRDRLAIAKDASGRFYVPSIGFSNMQPLRRGQGYYVRVTEATNLVYNLGQAASAPFVEISPSHFAMPIQTSQSMSVLLSGSTELEGKEVAAITPDGKIIGATVLQGHAPWGMALWADDQTTIEKDGAAEGEAIKFLVWNEGKEVELQSSWSSKSVFVGDGFEQARLAIVEPLPQLVRLDPPMPNPFNSVATLTFALPSGEHVRLAVYDLAGKEVTRLIDGLFKAGTHKVTWVADGYPTGVYLAKMTTSSVTRTTKMMLIR